jgi:hypothetical protein
VWDVHAGLQREQCTDQGDTGRSDVRPAVPVNNAVEREGVSGVRARRTGYRGQCCGVDRAVGSSARR